MLGKAPSTITYSSPISGVASEQYALELNGDITLRYSWPLGLIVSALINGVTLLPGGGSFAPAKFAMR